MPDTRAAVREWLASHSDLTPEQLKAVAYELIRQPYADDRNAGILVLAEHVADELGFDDLADFRALFEEGHLADWSSVDWFCVKLLGRMLERSPDAQRIADELVGWTASDLLWLRRAGLVGFVNLAPAGDAKLPGLTERVLTGAARNVADERRFAQTSVGWVLRELSKAEPGAVRAFVEEHDELLSAEARRMARAKIDRTGRRR
jgi:3-methyladenine DNA glycosylase AlkD